MASLDKQRACGALALAAEQLCFRPEPEGWPMLLLQMAGIGAARTPAGTAPALLPTQLGTHHNTLAGRWTGTRRRTNREEGGKRAGLVAQPQGLLEEAQGGECVG